MNKITPAPFPPPKIKKVFQKKFFYFLIFLKTFFMGGGVINKLQYGARFAGEKLFEIF